MNKKGYTLIELIVVIAIVATIGTFGAIGFSKIINNNKEERYNEMLDDIKASANTYFSIYSEKPEYSNLRLKEQLYSGNKTLIIPISDLKDALLVEQNLKNPKDNKEVNGCVVITNYESIVYKVCPYENCSCDQMS